MKTQSPPNYEVIGDSIRVGSKFFKLSSFVAVWPEYHNSSTSYESWYTIKFIFDCGNTVYCESGCFTYEDDALKYIKENLLVLISGSHNTQTDITIE